MMFDHDKHHRRSLRLKGYDYAQAGAYFVTVCIQNRECLLGDVVGGEMHLKGAGEMVTSVWQDLPVRCAGTELDKFVVMPNHVHGIALVGAPLVGAQNNGAGTRPAPTLGEIVGTFKSLTTNGYIVGVKQHGWTPFHGQLWQRNYYEHIVRNDEELNQIREYITNNPMQWELDRENPALRSMQAQRMPLRGDEPWQF